ncbi:hypothetical protein TNCV_2593911 [Trichonephila clavipes]|nr:hypothetical protein TNCV_2593911 [Trichonephila clavipes]
MRCKVMLYDVADFEYLLVKDNPILLVCTAKFVFSSYKTWITSKTPINLIPQVCNKRHVWRISRLRKKILVHVFGLIEVLNSLCNMWGCIILLKDSSRHALKEGMTSGVCTSPMYLLLLRLPSIRSKLDRP